MKTKVSLIILFIISVISPKCLHAQSVQYATCSTYKISTTNDWKITYIFPVVFNTKDEYDNVKRLFSKDSEYAIRQFDPKTKVCQIEWAHDSLYKSKVEADKVGSDNGLLSKLKQLMQGRINEKLRTGR